MDSDTHQMIIPRFKLIIQYDILPDARDAYYQFVLGEFVPALQEMGVYMTEAWHTAYGPYPIRMTTFVTEDFATIEELFRSPRWEELETRFLGYVENYTRKVISYRSGFQIVATQQNN